MSVPSTILGDIRASFEEQAEVPLEDFTAANQLKLFSRRHHGLLLGVQNGVKWKYVGRCYWLADPSGSSWNPFELLDYL